MVLIFAKKSLLKSLFCGKYLILSGAILFKNVLSIRDYKNTLLITYFILLQNIPERFAGCSEPAANKRRSSFRELCSW